MDLQALKLRPTADLAELADQLSPIGGHRLTRHDLLTHILNACAENQEPITGGGTLEIVEGGFGFLRGSETSYLPANSDIYVSPSQVKRFSLRTGDSIHGVVRRPKDNERYLALLKIVEINGRYSDEIDPRGDFDDLTPMLADEVLQLLDPFCEIVSWRKAAFESVIPEYLKISTIFSHAHKALLE